MSRAWTDLDLEVVKIGAMQMVTFARDNNLPFVIVNMETGKARALAEADLDPFGGLPELEDVSGEL